MAFRLMICSLVLAGGQRGLPSFLGHLTFICAGVMILSEEEPPPSLVTSRKAGLIQVLCTQKCYSQRKLAVQWRASTISREKREGNYVISHNKSWPMYLWGHISSRKIYAHQRKTYWISLVQRVPGCPQPEAGPFQPWIHPSGTLC